MNTRIVTVARQVGTGGEEVAQGIADRLGFRYIDYQVIQAAASDANVSPETVSESEHSPSLMTRILEALARNPTMPAAAWADPIPLNTSPLTTSGDYRHFIEDVIRDLAQQGSCVIIGHAAQVILRDRLDTLTLLVTGSSEHRARRIMAGMGVDQKAALKTVERTDQERVDYYRRFYETGWLSPQTYDLCISTDHMNPEQAAELAATAARMR
ncbi:MAG TPA: cytidylate kinase-like family protein [Tepidiformaceae bacterium]|nr:cytidylate kinase-like family protein [Tepidiformaceae bacterium]